MSNLNVAVIGAGWMGHVHARAYARLAQHWPDLGIRPSVVAVAESAAPAAEAFTRAHSGGRADGIRVHSDWREVLADPEIGAVSVTAPNFLHREIGVAVAEAGKHLWIEKPVGLSAADATAVRDAVVANGVVGCVGFNYRNVPAVARARRLIASGSREHGRGRVVLIGSITAEMNGTGDAMYAASKAALSHLGRQFARDWVRQGINVNCIQPGWIATEINAQWFSTERGQAEIAALHRRRLLEADPVNDMLLYLLSDRARQVTGSTFTIDDGQSLL